MVRPTLAEIRKFQINGKMPESLKRRREEAEKERKKAEKAKPDNSSDAENSGDVDAGQSQKGPEANSSEDPEQAEFPKESGGGWWELSNGKKVQSEEKAKESQTKLNAS